MFLYLSTIAAERNASQVRSVSFVQSKNMDFLFISFFNRQVFAPVPPRDRKRGLFPDAQTSKEAEETMTRRWCLAIEVKKAVEASKRIVGGDGRCVFVAGCR